MTDIDQVCSISAEQESEQTLLCRLPHPPQVIIINSLLFPNSESKSKMKRRRKTFDNNNLEETILG